MRFLVTQQQRIASEDDTFLVCSPEECLKYLSDKKIIGLDIETEGFDPYTKKILLCQFGDKHNQFAIDNTINLEIFRHILEDKERLFILHNAKFDLRFFYHLNIWPAKVFDTYLAEKLMFLGYPSGMHGMSLAACCYNYLNVSLDKSIRGDIHRFGLSNAVIQYGCKDVEYLEDLMNAQLIELEKKDLLRAIDLENEFVKWLAYIEYCGVKLDPDKWHAKVVDDLEELANVEEELNNWVINNADPKYIEDATQGDLFSSDPLKPKCKLNWASSTQTIPFFKELGFDLWTIDKETGNPKESVDAKIIKAQRYKNPEFVGIYIKYKECAKTCSTYGKDFINSINPVSKRLHTTFNQLMDTGRLSSGGGKDKDRGTKLPNLQNLPRGVKTRSCFVAEPGNKWISADYKSQESVIIANVTQDPAMIKFFKEGKGDIHSLAAKMAFPEELNNCPLEEVQAKFPHIRQKGKAVEFAINYGGNGATIAGNLGLPIDLGNKIYTDYLNGFYGLKTYMDWARKEVMSKGYILHTPVTGHKAYIYDFEELDNIRSQMDKEFWDIYRQEKLAYSEGRGPYTERMKMVKHYFKRKSTSEKQSINYRIQSIGALTFKYSAILFFNWLKKNNLLGIVKYCIPVHDKYLLCINCVNCWKLLKI